MSFKTLFWSLVPRRTEDSCPSGSRRYPDGDPTWRTGVRLLLTSHSDPVVDSLFATPATREREDRESVVFLRDGPVVPVPSVPGLSFTVCALGL